MPRRVLLLVYEGAARRYRRRHIRPVTPDAAALSDVEITRWIAVVDRVLRSSD